MKMVVFSRWVKVSLVLLMLSSWLANAQTEYLNNPGFESGTTSWNMAGPVVLTTAPHTGTRNALMGETAYSTDTMYQAVTIPGTATAATLTYWYNITSSDTGSTANDVLTVTIQNSSGTTLATVDTKSNVNRDPAAGNPYYHQIPAFDLLPYKGQQIRIHFKVVMNGSVVTSFRIDDVSVMITTGSVPASPTGLLAAGGESGVAIVWTDNSSNEDGFHIERKTGAGGTFAYHTSVAANSVSYGDTSVTAGNTYYYRVYAYNAAGFSPFYSNEAYATAGVPNSPTGLTATGAPNSIALLWTDNASLEQGFYIERKTGAGGTFAYYDFVDANVTTYMDTSVSVGTTYYYRVYAYNTRGYSAFYSNEASASPQAVVKPTVQTLAATSITTTSATLNGRVTSTGGASITERRFEWAKNSGTWGTGTSGVDYGIINDAAITVSGNDFSATLSGLQANTAYKYRVYAKNSAGFSDASAVNIETFTTSAAAPDIRITPLQLTVDCVSAPSATASRLAGEVVKKPVWDGVLRGMPPSPSPFTATQPDGSKITLFLRGSVKFDWLEDSNGYTVVRNKGSYVFAKVSSDGLLIPTSLLVGKSDPAKAGIKKRVLPTAKALEKLGALSKHESIEPTPLRAPNGNVKNVVILMRFSNHTGRTLPSVANFNTIFNTAGGDPQIAPSGSVRDVYYENSYGTMTLNSTVFAWVTLPQTEAYYADGENVNPQYRSGRGPRFKEALVSALNLVDQVVDFSQFDDDDDDFVDAITFIHSGYGAETPGIDADGATEANRIWSHRHALFTTWTSAEGVKVSDYNINPGLWGTSGSEPGHIGVICHEIGHFFGLPDLYDTDSDVSYGIGSWCMMANSWGFTQDQRNPPHFSAWAKINLGWVTPTLISAPGVYTAPRVETSPTIFRINTGYPANEYLLIENRQAYGFDKNIPQGGLAIWHIDENKTGNTDQGYPGQSEWPSNNKHYKVALLQADGNYNLERNQNQGDAGDLYHGGGVSQISHGTVPSTDGYQNGTIVDTGNRIYGISASGASMTFNYSSDSFTIYNDGAGTLTVTSIALEEAASWITWSAPATPFNVAPGGSQTVRVSVDCSQAPTGQSTRRILINSNDSDESPYPSGVNVVVTTPSPTISVSPSSRDFGSVEVGSTADRTFEVENTGGGTLSGSATVSAPFSVVSGSPYNLTANQSTTVTIRYSPTSAGNHSQDVTFSGGGSATRQVSGSAYLPTVATPTFSPNGGNFFDSVQVTINCSTADATIRYTTDGNDPTTGSAAYSAPLTLTSSATIKAKAFKSGHNDSSVGSVSFTVTPTPTVATPIITPNGGNFLGPVQVTIDCSTALAAIRYTTDGTDPTGTASLYTAPFEVASSTTIKAKAFKSAYNDSTIATASFAFATAPTLASPSLSGSLFTVSVPAQDGFSRVLEFKHSLNDASWTPVHTNTAAGGTIGLTNSGAGGPSRFYRVRIQKD